MSQNRQHSGGADAAREAGGARQRGQKQESGAATRPRQARRAVRQGQSTPARTQSTQRRTESPTGLRLVAITVGALGGVLVLAGLTLLEGASDLPGGVAGTFELIGLLAGGFGAGHLVAAYGLWSVTSWGRTLTLWLLAGGLLASLIVLRNGGSGGVLGIVLYGGAGWYLYTSGGVYRRLRRAS